MEGSVQVGNDHRERIDAHIPEEVFDFPITDVIWQLADVHNAVFPAPSHDTANSAA